MKRTRRIEVIRYTRRVNVPDSGSEAEIAELLAIVRSHEFTSDNEDAVTLPEPVPVPPPRSTLCSRAQQVLRRFKKAKARRLNRVQLKGVSQ